MVPAAATPKQLERGQKHTAGREREPSVNAAQRCQNLQQKDRERGEKTSSAQVG